MARQPRVSPPPRARRAVNVEDAVPVVPDHVRLAREYVVANKAKNAAAAVEKVAFDDCWAAMNKQVPPLGSFDFVEGNKTYDAVIAGTEDKTIDVRRLYGKIAAGDITLEQFLNCVSATQGNVKKELGANMLAAVLDKKPGEAKLTIKERK